MWIHVNGAFYNFVVYDIKFEALLLPLMTFSIVLYLMFQLRQMLEIIIRELVSLKQGVSSVSILFFFFW